MTKELFKMDTRQLGTRVREARLTAELSQEDAAAVLGISQPTYSRIEDGTRALKGDELIMLADAFGIRAAAITGLGTVQDRARFAARTDGTNAPMDMMRQRLYAYLELDSYLAGQGLGKV